MHNYAFSIAEPGLVDNLQASFDTIELNFNPATRMYTLDMNIMWDEPTNPNGIITSYEVTVQQTDDSSVTVYTNAMLIVTSVTPSVMVLPFTDYTVTVAASTSAGQGENTSITVESPEAGREHWFMLFLKYTLCMTLSSDIHMCYHVKTRGCICIYIYICA